MFCDIEIFKLGFVGEFPYSLPSPAEKGDREAVDEESICNLTYWVYSYVLTTTWIDVSKMVDAKVLFGFFETRKVVGRFPLTREANLQVFSSSTASRSPFPAGEGKETDR